MSSNPTSATSHEGSRTGPSTRTRRPRLFGRLGRLDNRESGFDLVQSPTRADQAAMFSEQLVDGAAELGSRSAEEDQVVADALEVVQEVRGDDDRKAPVRNGSGEGLQELAAR